MSTQPDPNAFAVTPDRRDLDQMERRFEFHPARESRLKVLAPDQIAQFNSQGFLTGIPVFSGDEIQDIRRYFDALLERTLQAGESSYSISTAHLKHGRVHDLMRDPRLTDIMQDLLGENVIGWGAHFFCKMPGDGKAVAWHQDASYWPMSESRTLTVWLAVDDADEGNGCMQVIPGTHQDGLMPYRESASAENNVLNQTIETRSEWPRPAPIALKAGQISIHADLLVHGSQPNQSDRRRCGLTLRYCPPEVRAGEDWQAKGVWVAGEDPEGHWANAPRPQTE